MQAILEAIEEANKIQQDKIEKLIKDLLNDWSEQKLKKKGFPLNPKSKLKPLVKEEAKKEFKKNHFSQIYPKKFLKSEGLKKIRKDAEKEIADSTIKRWLREANVELLAKHGQTLKKGRPCSSSDRDERVDALRKHEEEPTSLTLKEAVVLICEAAVEFVKVSKEGTIGRSPRLKRAVSLVHQYIEGKGEFAESGKQLDADMFNRFDDPEEKFLTFNFKPT